MAAILEKGKHFFVFLFLILIPFCFEDIIAEPSNLPRFLYFSLFLVLGLIKVAQKPSHKYPPLKLFGLLLLFYLFNLASSCWALNIGDALYESQRVFLGLSTVAYYLNVINSDEEEELLIRSFIGITILCCLYPLLQIMRLNDFSIDSLHNVSGFSEHTNLLSSMLMLIMSFALYGILFMNGKSSVIAFVAAVLLLFIIIILQVRSVYLGTGVGFFVFLCFGFFKLETVQRKKIGLLLAVVLIFIAVSTFYKILQSPLNLNSYVTSESGAERLKIWSKTWSLIKDHPWFGVGAGNWQYNFMKYGVFDIPNIYLNNVSFQRPYNDLLWVLSETGIFCFFVLILKMITILLYTIREVFKRNNLKVLLFFSFLCALITDAFFSFPKERITHIALACTLLALLLRNLQPGSLMIRHSKLSVYAGILILTFGIVVGIFRLKGEYFTNLLLTEKNKNDARRVINYGKKAENIFYATDPSSTPIASYLGWAYNSLNRPDSALYFSKEAYDLSPYDFEVLSNYGYALDRSGNREKARTILEESFRINPYHEQTLVNLTVVEYNTRNYQRSLEWLTKVPEHKTKYAQYFELLQQKMK